MPALGSHRLTRLYDPIGALLQREGTLEGRLIEHAPIAPGHDVLDVEGVVADDRRRLFGVRTIEIGVRPLVREIRLGVVEIGRSRAR